ncbi:subtilisin-like protease [Paraphaeosphaeria sporulosa]
MRTFIKFLLVLPAVFAAPTLEPETIAGSYIFKLRKGSALGPVSKAVSNHLKIKPARVYSLGDFQAFHIKGVRSTTGLLEKFGQIESIEPDAKVYASKLETQTSAPWGLGRISHSKNGSTEYVYDGTVGVGTFAYVVDTGIRTTHKEFGGRAVWGSNHVDDNNTDGNGHGTHVAGTIGSKTYGVAKNTTLVAVKVLDATGAGAISGVIEGVIWAANDMVARNRTGKAVANLSLGGAASASLDKAVAAAIKQGLFFAVAAGNSAILASMVSPARVPEACTVGATDQYDNLASFSNWGPSVDIHAPGVNVLSTSNQGDTATATLSGTSMAAPHVAGLGAYFLALPGNKPTPDELCKHIKDRSTKNVINTTLAIGLVTTKDLAYNGSGK